MQILNIDFSLWFFRIKLFSGILSLIFGGVGVYFIVQFQKLVGVKAQASKLALRLDQAQYMSGSESKWEEIKRHINSDRESDWKLAVIDADKFLDDLLKKDGYPGETMGDRLMSIDKAQFVSLDGLWEAHKIRNKLAHDVNYFLRYAEAKRAIQCYEAALNELGSTG